MLELHTNNLTTLEKKIHSILIEEFANSNLKIVDAAELCGVAPSKVSRVARKLGFENFKQYKSYFSGHQEEIQSKKKSSEIERLMFFLKNYDDKITDEFISVFKKFNKIIIYGLGPSYIAGEYFSYKLSTITNQNVFVTQNEEYAARLADKDTLLIVLSVTGKFASFEKLFKDMHKENAEVMLILEEYFSIKDSIADYILFLTKHTQSDKLLPFEKSRTIFFIFIEEVINKLKTEEEYNG